MAQAKEDRPVEVHRLVYDVPELERDEDSPTGYGEPTGNRYQPPPKYFLRRSSLRRFVRKLAANPDAHIVSIDRAPLGEWEGVEFEDGQAPA